jgi:hypothetical protein
MGELRARKATPSLADPLTPHGRPSAVQKPEPKRGEPRDLASLR